MSATARAGDVTSLRARRLREPAVYRLFVCSVLAVELVVLSVSFRQGGLAIEGEVLDLLVWTGLVTCASLLPVDNGRGSWLSLDLPLLLAVGFVFGPTIGGLVGLLGAMDLREIKRGISPSRAIFNRAQVSLSTMAGAFAFEALGGPRGTWPLVALAGIAGLIADCLVNYSLVAMSTSITQGRSVHDVAKEMRLGTPRVFIPAYAAFGFLAVLIAEAYHSIGIAGVLASIAPVLLARLAFEGRHELDSALDLLRLRERALTELDQRVAAERKEERMVLAGELHDEVLPPLFKVHLMGQVLKQDLSSGRLLDLDQDLPELLEATEAAQCAIRDLLGDLRRSPLGVGGLVPSLRLLVDQLEGAGGPRILLDVSEVDASERSQLLAFQVAREALGNASKYSMASAVQVRLWSVDGLVRILIQDDGVGFNVEGVDRERHFGLQLIVERVTRAGGQVVLQSVPGSGTLVAAALPPNL